MKVLSVFGTRPEAIKLAPVLRELGRRNASGVASVVCVTGQHREMLDGILTGFGIKPDFDLAVMKENQTPSGVASAVLAKLPGVLREVRPDWVVVQGDTTTVAAAALAAAHERIAVAHVEAGLRTYDKWQPFPEEMNRRIASVIADLHFAPTETSRRNLLSERVPDEHVLVTGNPVIDAAQQVASLPAPAAVDWLAGVAPDQSKRRRLVVVTAHRRENLGKPLEGICEAVRDLAHKYRDSARFVFPVHLNPNVQSTVRRVLGDVPNVVLTAPLEYFSMIHVMRLAHLVLTDSGGIQEEAPSFGVPVLVLREVTERPEAVEAGTVRIVGTRRETILREASRLMDDPAAHAEMARSVNPYGDGQAGRRIVSALLGEPVDPFRPAGAQGGAAPTLWRKPAYLPSA